MFSETSFEGVDRDTAFCAMVSEITWQALEALTTNSSVLKERAQRGGHRIACKNRSHVERVLIRASSPFLHDSPHVRDAFMAWYLDQEFADAMQKYFLSDNYTAWAESSNIPEGEYRFQDESFTGFSEMLLAAQLVNLLYFSPVAFTDTQITILQSKQTKNHLGNADDGQSASCESHGEGTAEDIESLRTELRKVRDERRSLRRDKRKLQSQMQTLETAAENARASADLSRKQCHESQKELSRVSGEIACLREEASEAASTTRLMESEIKIGHRQVAKLRKQVDRAGEQVRELRASLLLDQLADGGIVSHELVAALNEPDEVKELLLSNVKLPEKDADLQDDYGSFDFEDYWKHLMDDERITIQEFLQINVADVMQGLAVQNWASRADQLVDLKYSLRARAVLVGIVYEILRQRYEREAMT